MKAIVVTAVWHMLAQGKCYLDPGPDFFTKKDPIRTKNNPVHPLQTLACNLSLGTREGTRAPYFRIWCRINFATDLTAPTL